MRYQGAGSSALRPARLVSPREAFDKAGVAYEYIRGYRTREGRVDPSLVEEALRASQRYDTVLVFAGLTELYESAVSYTHLQKVHEYEASGGCR